MSLDVSEIELAAAAALRESSRPRLVVVDDKRVAASTQLMKIERITLKGKRKKMPLPRTGGGRIVRAFNGELARFAGVWQVSHTVAQVAAGKLGHPEAEHVTK